MADYKQTEKYKKYNREYARKYRKAHPEYIKLCNIKYGRPYRLKHKNELAQYNKEYRAKNKDHLRIWKQKYVQKNKTQVAICKMRSQFHISRAEAELWYAEKLKGICNICGQPEESLHFMLSVDHNHKTGKIRGVLCGRCNKGLGAFRDDPKLLMQASLYLWKQ